MNEKEYSVGFFDENGRFVRLSKHFNLKADAEIGMETMERDIKNQNLRLIVWETVVEGSPYGDWRDIYK